MFDAAIFALAVVLLFAISLFALAVLGDLMSVAK